MADNGGNSIPGGLAPNSNPAWEAFAKYFKNSQSVIGTLNPNIFWQLYNDANPSEEANDEEDDGEPAPNTEV